MKLNKHVMAMNLAAVIAFGAVAGIVAPSVVGDDAIVAYAADENKAVSGGDASDVLDKKTAGVEIVPDEAPADKNVKFESTADGTVAYTVAKQEDAKKVVIPDTIKVNGKDVAVTAIKEGTFTGSGALEELTLGANIKELGANALKDCKNLTKFDASKSPLEKIGKYALKNAKKLKSFKINGKKLKKSKIDKTFVKGCKKLKTIKVKASKKQFNKIKGKFETAAKKTGYKKGTKVKKS
ncbi:MAG: leucine-rich repeat domain-containing protein [Butyrivibrio sp.]|nr:leucine-rich repeat domain-containing protein [Butyrivibrio sp.]